MSATIKTLTIRQPWASLLVAGCKRYEYRSKDFAHPALLAIHAGLKQEEKERKAMKHPEVRRCLPQVDNLPFGAVLAIGRLAATHRLTERAARAIKHEYPGRGSGDMRSKAGTPWNSTRSER